MFKNLILCSIVLFVFQSSYGANLPSSTQEEEEEAETATLSTSENIERLISAEALPPELQNQLPNLLPYLPQSGDSFFFTQQGDKYHLYRDSATQSVKIGTFFQKVGDNTVKNQNYMVSPGLYYSNYSQASTVSNNSANNLIASYQADLPRLEQHSSQIKNSITPNPNFADDMTRSFSEDHAISQIKNGFIGSSVVIHPNHENLNKEFSIINLPTDILQQYKEIIKGSNVPEHIAYSPATTFSYVVTSDKPVSESNPVKILITFAEGGNAYVNLPKEYLKTFTNKGMAYVKGKGYFHKIPSENPNVVMQQPNSKIEEFLSDPIKSDTFSKISETGIMPKEWSNIKFDFSYMNKDGKVISGKYNLKELSDLLYGSAKARHNISVIADKEVERYKQSNEHSSYIPNYANPDVPADPNFNKEGFIISYYDTEGNLQTKNMNLAEAYAFMTNDKKLQNRPKAKDRNDYLRKMAKYIKENKYQLGFKIADSSQTNSYFYNYPYDINKKIIINLKTSEEIKFGKLLDNPNFEDIARDTPPTKLRNKSKRINGVIMSKIYYSPATLKKHPYILKLKNHLGSSKSKNYSKSSSYKFSKDAILKIANEEIR